MALDQNIGMVTAYAYAVSKGYTGTEEQFAQELASAGADLSQIQTQIDNFINTIVPAKTAEVTAEGTRQIGLVAAEGTAQKNAVTEEGTTQKNAVTAEGTTQKNAVNSAGSTQVNAVNSAGSTQVGNVNTAGSTQVSAVQAKGQEVINSIPSDYTELSDEVADLKSSLSDIPTSINPDMTVGSLMSEEYTEEKVPYLYRVAGGGVEVGKVLADEIVGGTVAWNQLVQNGDFASTTGWSVTNGTMSIQDNVLTAVGTGDATPYLTTYYINKVANHKYYFAIDVFPQATMSAFAILSPFAFRKENVAGNTWSTLAGIVNYTGSTGSSNMPYYFNYTGANSGKTTKFRNNMIIDLTLMFGTTIADHLYSLEQSTAGAGVAVFRKLFPNAYYPYCQSELRHVTGVSEHKTVGFNQWDEEWELGILNATTGAKQTAQNSIITKNHIPVIPNSTYYINTKKYNRICLYDSNKAFLGIADYTLSGDGYLFHTENASYIMCDFSAGYGTTYNHDICINLSSDRNGEYEPYKSYSYPLDSSLTLRGIPKLSNGSIYWDGDTYSADGVVTRKYGIVDLGSLNYTYTNNSNRSFFTANANTIPNIKRPSTNAYALVGIAPTYQIVSMNSTLADMNIACDYAGASQNRFIVVNNSYTDTTAFKTAMSGVYLVYELATPTTEQAEPYTEYQHVTNGGTEEYVSTGIVPVGHVTKYYGDIGSKVDALPADFSNIIAPTEKAYKATRAYTVNELIIINNVLYKVTANIANGATITVGTNVQQTTLSALIKALS